MNLMGMKKSFSYDQFPAKHEKTHTGKNTQEYDVCSCVLSKVTPDWTPESTF